MRIRTVATWAMIAGMTANGSGSAAAQQPVSRVAGTWSGVLEAGGVRLTMVFHVAAAQDGRLSATLDSPDQGATGIPVNEVTFADSVLKMASATVRGEYEGKLSADGTKLSGEWHQGGMTFPLELIKGRAPERKPKPQEPQPPLPYESVDVRFRNAGANIELAGTLTLPRGAARVAAVVLISGSGAQDRDESLLGHKPFLVLADHLTRNGIAVLRYDDRGAGQSGGSFAMATSLDFMTDALAAVTYLASRQEIDAAKIGLIGHSEGGMVAPLAATRSDDVAFIVLLAGTGVAGEEILYAQGEQIARASGAPESAIRKNVEAQRLIFAAVKENSGPGAADRVRGIMREQLASLTDAERAAMGLAGDMDAIIQAQTAQVTSPWFRWFLTHDPAPVLEQVDVPVLALNGELDLQVPPDQNLPAIEAALRRGGNDDFTVRRLPGLNHLFQSATTGAPAEYAQIEETFSPAALDLISAWINARFDTSGRR